MLLPETAPAPGNRSDARKAAACERARGEHADRRADPGAQDVGHVADTRVDEQLQELEQRRAADHQCEDAPYTRAPRDEPQESGRDPQHDVAREIVCPLRQARHARSEGNEHDPTFPPLPEQLGRADREIERQQRVSEQHQQVREEQALGEARRPAHARPSAQPVAQRRAGRPPREHADQRADRLREQVVQRHGPLRKEELRELDRERQRDRCAQHRQRREDPAPRAVRPQRPERQERQRDEQQNIGDPVGTRANAEVQPCDPAEGLKRLAEFARAPLERHQASVHDESRVGERREREAAAASHLRAPSEETAPAPARPPRRAGR